MSGIREQLERENDERYLALRRANQSLERQLAREKLRTQELAQRAYEGARDAMSSVVIPPVELQPRFRGQTSEEEWAFPLLSDTQIGKVTPTYNSSIAAERVALYADKIIQLTEIQRSHHPVRFAHVSLLGDMVEGEDIFPGQRYLIDSSILRQALITGPEILVPFFMRLLRRGGFEFINVDCVDGNHGRIGKKGEYHPETNSDRMLYIALAELFQRETKYRDRIRFRTGEDLHPGIPNWYRIGEIGNYRVLQIHGWEIAGNGPWHGLTLKQKVNSWAAGGIDAPFQDMVMGHYHQTGLIPLNQRCVIVNGSTESGNDFARHIIGAQAEPKQWLMYVDPRRGRVTNRYDVDLMTDTVDESLTPEQWREMLRQQTGYDDDAEE